MSKNNWEFICVKHTTLFMRTIITILFMACCLHSHAQSEIQGSDLQKKALSKTIVVSGYITDWIENTKDYLLDGFNFQANEEKLMVMFPVHMSKELRRTIKTGNTITISGLETKDSLGVIKIDLVSVTNDGITIEVSPPFLPGVAPMVETINGKATIRELQKNVDGKISGYILDNKTILRLAANISNELIRLLVAGATVSYSGIKSNGGSGEDAWASYTIIRCQSIFIDGKQYLTD